MFDTVHQTQLLPPAASPLSNPRTWLQHHIFHSFQLQDSLPRSASSSPVPYSALNRYSYEKVKVKVKVKVFCLRRHPNGHECPITRSRRCIDIHFTLMPSHEYPIPWVPAQKNLLPVGIVPGTSRTEVRLTNHLASRTSVRALKIYQSFKVKVCRDLILCDMPWTTGYLSIVTNSKFSCSLILAAWLQSLACTCLAAHDDFSS